MAKKKKKTEKSKTQQVLQEGHEEIMTETLEAVEEGQSEEFEAVTLESDPTAVDEDFNEEELAKLFADKTEEPELDFLESEARAEETPAPSEFAAEGTELEAFASAEIEQEEFLEEDRIVSIVESMLFSTDRPVSIAAIKQCFKGTQVKT
ncbi:MAG: hypothetical protein KDD22_06095, partial [Bdellovibrionales bacterium]|nr:hypothetical protein [Bdellovibrionales bacterium]